MKVYEILTHTAYEFEHEIDTQIYLDEKKARADFKNTVKKFRKEAKEEELEIDEGKDYFDAYLDGEANVGEANVYELEVRFTEVTPIE